MKYEVFISRTTHLRFRQYSSEKLLNQCLTELNIVPTEYSSFWNATNFILDVSPINILDKIQIVTLFLLCGGIVEFDGHAFSPLYWGDSFWGYLLEHKVISNDDYEALSQWGIDGKISSL